MVPPPKLYTLAQIQAAISDPSKVVDAMEECFKVYSKHAAHVAPVIHLGDPEPALVGGGSVCVKTGYVLGGEHYVVKVAGGGFKNSGNSGAMLVFCQKTGHLKAVLFDECELTEMRTAAAGALSVRELGPSNVRCIGVVGYGVQARYQLQFLKYVTSCRKVIVCGRNMTKARAFCERMSKEGFEMSYTQNYREMARQCNVIVTVTTSCEPLLDASMVQPGTHFVCIGADAHGKQELDPQIVATADLVVVDSIKQCVEIGEVQHALQKGMIAKENLVEFGNYLQNKQRRPAGAITVFDSTGVAIQDVAITEMAYGVILEHEEKARL